METVGARLGRVESWAVWGPDLDSPWSSWRGGLYERTGPSLYGWGGRIEQEDFLKKKKTLRGTLGNSAAAAATVSSPTSRPPCVSAGLWGASSPNPKNGEWGECTPGGRAETTGT